jgi:hypothetical protein
MLGAFCKIDKVLFPYCIPRNIATMKKQDKVNKINLDRLFNILALVAGIVALFFSWQANIIAKKANSIASQQVTAKIVVLSSDYNGEGFQSIQGRNQYTIRCRQVIRLSNLGGAATSLVGYDATIRYKDSELHASSENASVISTESFNPLMHNFQFVFLKRETLGETQGFDWIDEKYYLPFPVAIDAFSTIDIDAAVNFLLDGIYHEGEIEMPLYPYQFEHPKSIYGLPPLEVTYTFKTASGQTATTSKMLCLYLK